MQVPLVKELGHLPIIVDPSHAAGPLASGAVSGYSCGSWGRMESWWRVHPDPQHALSDGFQSLRPDHFKKNLVDEVEEWRRWWAESWWHLVSRVGPG